MNRLSPLEVIDDPARVATLALPLRRLLLSALEQPDSATGLARRLELPRQKINYHLRELESAGFVELVEQRQRRGCIERILRATSRSYLVNPRLLPELATDDPELRQDRFSSAYLVVTAARLMQDAATLRRRAAAARQRLATFAVETELSFSSPTALKGFQEELVEAMARLATKYQDTSSPQGRRYRFVLGGHPTITKSEAEAQREARALPLEEEAP